jgi:endonuclease/exonuclease/phosphatase family metal-dependent hydrolase
MLAETNRTNLPAWELTAASGSIGCVHNWILRAASLALQTLAIVAAPLTPARADSRPVELVVLSYNTHGLPGWAAGDEPEQRFPRIGALLQRYDVALVQEDFAHHERLAGATAHPIVLRGNGSRYSWLGRLGFLCGRCGSGLTVLAREPFRHPSRVLREPFSSCSGWLGSGNDCWATKGILMARLEPGNGPAIDFFNLHLDAGDGRADRGVREEQIGQVARAIRVESDGRPLIVGGDLNLHHDNPEDRTIFEEFRASLRLVDSRAALSDPNGWPEKIDYLLFRGGDALDLELIEAGIAKEFADETGPLSDHPAIYARFRLRRISKGGMNVAE